MMPDGKQVIEYLTLLGIGGVFVEFVRAMFLRKKMGADYADIISASAVRLLDPLERRIRELEGELEATKKELVEARKEAHALREENRAERMSIVARQETASRKARKARDV